MNNATDQLVNAVLKAESDSVYAGYQGTTAMQCAAAGDLKASREELAKSMGVNPECDLFNAALKSCRVTAEQQRIGKLCYAK